MSSQCHLTYLSTKVLITGISPKSLGEALAIAIWNHSPTHLILASRTKSKLEEVQQKLKPSPGSKITLLPIDLSSQASIRNAVITLNPRVPHIDVLINNAGVVSSARQETSDGLELQFGTNHVGHFLLTSLLMPKLLSAKYPRVVNVSSMGYRLSPFRFHDYNFEAKPVPAEEMPPKGLPKSFTPDASKGRNYVTFCAYAQSKTANILHAVGLNDRYGDKGLTPYAVHPGSKSSSIYFYDIQLLTSIAQPYGPTSQDLFLRETIRLSKDRQCGRATTKGLLRPSWRLLIPYWRELGKECSSMTVNSKTCCLMRKIQNWRRGCGS